ncbi:VOC family protein [Nocardia sp. NPDC006044]|uniref:VOC family protein n=1 Tax=Nocardia sp. NPDC006044 TaxID=3364306 RepID=UPI0036A5C0A4
MAYTLRGATLDCPNPGALARFYRSICGGRIVSSDAQFTHLYLDSGVSLGFQLDVEYRASTWPTNEIPQQCHLDFSAADLDQAQAEAMTAGAKLADWQPEPDVFRVLLDPAGHPFCFSTWGTPAGPERGSVSHILERR